MWFLELAAAVTRWADREVSRLRWTNPRVRDVSSTRRARAARDIHLLVDTVFNLDDKCFGARPTNAPRRNSEDTGVASFAMIYCLLNTPNICLEKSRVLCCAVCKFACSLRSPCVCLLNEITAWANQSDDDWSKRSKREHSSSRHAFHKLSVTKPLPLRPALLIRAPHGCPVKQILYILRNSNLYWKWLEVVTRIKRKLSNNLQDVILSFWSIVI